MKNIFIILFSFALLIFSSLKISFGQHTDIYIKPDYIYKIEKTRVYPDTSLLYIDYMDKNNKIVYTEELYNDKVDKITKNVYENELLKESYEKHIPNGTIEKHIPNGTIEKHLRKYLNDTVICYGYMGNSLSYLRIETYKDNSYKNIITDELYDIVNDDTTKWFTNDVSEIINSSYANKDWFYVTKYDSIGRVSAWTRLFDDIDSSVFYYEYSSNSDTIPSLTWSNYPNTDGVITKYKYSRMKKVIEVQYNSSIIQKKIEYYNKESFKFKEEIFGLYYFHYIDKENKTKLFILKSVTKKPDEIIVYKKYYR